jgi:hypothetical protein
MIDIVDIAYCIVYNRDSKIIERKVFTMKTGNKQTKEMNKMLLKKDKSVHKNHFAKVVTAHKGKCDTSADKWLKRMGKTVV